MTIFFEGSTLYVLLNNECIYMLPQKLAKVLKIENITGTTKEEIQREIEQKVLQYAYTLSIRLLSKKAYFSRILYEKLKKLGISDSICAQTVQKCTPYLNDEAYVRYFIESERKKGRSRAQILFKAKAKKCEKEAIAYMALQGKSQDIESIKALIEKKYKILLLRPSKEEKQKIYQALIRKGFSFSDIMAAFDELMKEDTVF